MNKLQLAEIQTAQRQISKQNGIALPLVLILLLVMTLLGITTLKMSMFEEQMAANARLREAAFNVAETTLRFGETHAERLKDNIRIAEIAYDGGTTRLFQNDLTNQQWPEPGVDHPGDSCTGGYCIPVQFHQSSNAVPSFERWEDPALDVWENGGRHHKYVDFDSAQFDLNGISEAPKYIIEYLGDYPVKNSAGDVDPKCGTFPSETGYNAKNVEWPYCFDDPSFFRVTARAVAGDPGKQSVVILQSTIAVPD